MLRKIHGTNFFHIKFLDRTNIKCKNGPVLPPAQVFYFNRQDLQYFLFTLPVLLSSVVSGKKKRIAPLSFFRGCRKSRLKD
jgi:hypothetical protein